MLLASHQAGLTGCRTYPSCLLKRVPCMCTYPRACSDPQVRANTLVIRATSAVPKVYTAFSASFEAPASQTTIGVYFNGTLFLDAFSLTCVVGGVLTCAVGGGV